MKIGEKKPVYWLGPKKCDICKKDITDILYDSKTRMGPWATMCSECYMKVRAYAGLGTGLGQKYQRQDDGRFLKIRG